MDVYGLRGQRFVLGKHEWQSGKSNDKSQIVLVRRSKRNLDPLSGQYIQVVRPVAIEFVSYLNYQEQVTEMVE